MTPTDQQLGGRSMYNYAYSSALPNVAHSVESQNAVHAGGPDGLSCQLAAGGCDTAERNAAFGRRGRKHAWVLSSRHALSLMRDAGNPP